jgi:hypothetical protein
MKIRKLSWFPGAEKGQLLACVVSGRITYKVYPHQGSQWRREGTLAGHVRWSVHDSLQEALAAAQEDFEEFVMSWIAH